MKQRRQHLSASGHGAVGSDLGGTSRASTGPSNDARQAQLHAAQHRSDPRVQATQGLQGAGAPLPFLDQIQQSFGEYDVSSVSAHRGAATKRASQALGADAFALGEQIALGDADDLFTAAHEAAHVVQQRAGAAGGDPVGAPGSTLAHSPAY